MNKESLKKLHDLSFKTRDILEIEGKGTCFDCLRVVELSDIKRWTDDQQTAICPHCSIDSILPGLWDAKLIEEMQDHYFTYQ